MTPPARVLIVEDDDATRDLLSLVLQGDGHQVEGAATAEDGLSRAAAGGLDLVLLDIGLPGMSGLEACRRFKAEAAGVPLILLTAEKRAKVKVEGLDAGADDYVVKPVDPSVLKARVAALLRRYRPR